MSLIVPQTLMVTARRRAACLQPLFRKGAFPGLALGATTARTGTLQDLRDWGTARPGGKMLGRLERCDLLRARDRGIGASGKRERGEVRLDTGRATARRATCEGTATRLVRG